MNTALLDTDFEVDATESTDSRQEVARLNVENQALRKKLQRVSLAAVFILLNWLLLLLCLLSTVSRV